MRDGTVLAAELPANVAGLCATGLSRSQPCGGDAGPLAPSVMLPDAALPRMSMAELTEADYRVTGVSLNGHPMRHLRPLLQPNGIRTARDVQTNGRDTEQVAIAGLVICRQRPGTAKGFVFLSLEDETGIVNVVVTPQRFERDALKISTSPLLMVRGTLQVESPGGHPKSPTCGHSKLPQLA